MVVWADGSVAGGRTLDIFSSYKTAWDEMPGRPTAGATKHGLTAAADLRLTSAGGSEQYSRQENRKREVTYVWCFFSHLQLDRLGRCYHRFRSADDLEIPGRSPRGQCRHS